MDNLEHENAHEETQHVSTPENTTENTQEVAPEVQPEAHEEAAPEAQQEATPEASAEATSEDAENTSDENTEDADEEASKAPQLLTIVIEGIEAMDRAETLTQIENIHTTLTGGEAVNFKSVDEALTKLKDRQKALLNEEREAARQDYIEKSEAKNDEGFEFQQDEVADKFFDLYKRIKAIKRKFFEDLEAEKESNLKKKEAILQEIREILQPAESPDEATSRKEEFNRITTLQKEWREIGQVPTGEQNAELQRNYKALLDQFYNLKKQERELRELGFRKNLEAKTRICERAEALLELENLNEAANQLNELHKEYKAVGPVPKADQEPLWQRFKAASDTIYDKRREMAKEFKAQLDENMKLKQALCLRVEEFATFTTDSIKEWNAKTGELKELQKEWDSIGPAPKEVSKTLNKQFWGNFKEFFNKKTAFFDELDKSREGNLKAKEALCEKAEKLKDSFEWDEATNEFKKMQADWKKIGPVPGKFRNSIYERFKKACDTFFDRRRNRSKEQNKEFEHNLQKKNEIAQAITALAEAGSNDMEALKKHYLEWLEVGLVGRSNADSAQDTLDAALDAFLAKQDMDETTRQQTKGELQIEALKASPKAARQFQRQEGGLQRRIREIEDDVNLWKTNLDFFANSKTADKLRDEFGAKIEKAEKELKTLRGQLRTIRKLVKEQEEAAKAEKESQKA